MSLREKLDIVLITYNRKDYLAKVLDEIFAENSPIKACDITILNNASNDGTTELVDSFCAQYPNLKQIINRVNIGGCANIAKAFAEIPQKEYVWVLADNDTFDWTSMNEVESAMEQGYDAIMTMSSTEDISQIYYNAALISGVIYKTSLITPTIAENIYDEIKNIFPHLSIIAKVINDKKKIYVVNKSIIKIGHNPNHNRSFTRGFELDDLPDSRKYIFWSVGYFASMELIKDKKNRAEIIDGTRHEHKSLYELFKTVMVQNKLYYDNYKENLCRIFQVLNIKQKFKFILAFLEVNLSSKDYKFYEMLTKQEWIEYLDTLKEQKYIDKLSKKLNGKKVLLYGAGLTAEVITEKYDLTKLNIIGISDRRFEDSNETECFGYKTVKPSEIKNANFDVIIFTMKLYEKIAQSFKRQGINKKMYSIIVKSCKYPVRS